MEITDHEYEKLRRKADDYDSDKHIAKLIVGGLVVLVVVVIGIIFMFKLVNPALNLRKANTEKQAVIKEQEAKSKAAEFEAKSAVTRATAEAEARVIEAESIAAAQEIIAATLTPEYLQWRYYEVLATTDNQIIYVPADGVPLTEAGRAVEPADAG
jgi:hypothetical protein